MASAVKGSKTPEKQLISAAAPAPPQNQKQAGPPPQKAAVSSANKGGGDSGSKGGEVERRGGGSEEDASHKLRGYLQVKHNPQNASGIKGRSRILRKVRRRGTQGNRVCD